MNYKSLISGKILLTLVFSSAMLIYVIVRANTLSFTHDESLSYTIVAGDGTWGATANNHSLNTSLMSASNLLFGNSELALRLPNVLSFVLYLAASLLIFWLYKNNWLLLLGISLVLLNPFLLEFFSLARGYGLSLAFMLMSLFFIIRNGGKNASYKSFIKDFIFAALFGSLAVYSNLGMLNFLIGILLIFTIKYWINRKEYAHKLKYKLGFLGVMLVSCIPLINGINHLLFLKQAGQLYYGASTFTETIDSLITSSLYFTAYGSWIVPAIKLFIVLCLVMGVCSVIIKKEYKGMLFLVTIQMFIVTLGLFLEHFLFDAKYPLERTALFYWPLISIFMYHLLQHLLKQYKVMKRLYIPIVLLLVLPLFANFLVGANFRYTKTWRYDAHTKDVMKIIKDKTQLADSPKSISNHWLFEPSINYYISVWKLNLNAANRNGVDLNSDFIYRLDDNTQLDGFTILEEYNDINSNLLWKNEPDKR